MLRTWLVFIFLFGLIVPLQAAEHDVEYEIDGELFTGYYISPVTEAAPLVFLVHDWDGLTGYEIKRAQMLSELGYAVFALDMYGKGVRPTALEEKRAKTKSLYSDRIRMRRLLNGGVEAAKKQGAQVRNSVIAGYCFGGAVALEYARSGADLKGFVSFHGGLTTPDGQNYENTKGQILVLHGTADAAVSMDDFAALAEELEQHGVKHEMITYSGAPHAFTVFGSERYRKDADEKSWSRFTQFLANTLRNESN